MSRPECDSVSPSRILDRRSALTTAAGSGLAAAQADAGRKRCLGGFEANGAA